MNPTVSVIIPNYNYGRFLSEAINSVLSQTYPCSEIIVVDDGSTDDSLEILDAHEKNGIRVIKQKNKGVGAARNAGVKASSGDLIAFLDADDFWLPQKTEKQVERLLFDKEFGMITCGMKEFSPSGDIIGKYVEGREGWCADDILLFKSVTAGPGSTCLIWRKVFYEIGGFDERKELHPSEDWEFCYRAARAAKIAFIPEILVAYRNHGGNVHLKIPRFERAMLIGYEKIFRAGDEKLNKLKRKCYGNLYKTLAGSYFHAGQYGHFLKNTFKSIILTPENISYFATFPLRKWKSNED